MTAILGRRKFLKVAGAASALAVLRRRGGAIEPRTLRWSFPSSDPVIRTGQLHGQLDGGRACASHVMDLGDRYRMYYWGCGSRRNVILMAESPKDRPNDWRPRGGVLLGPQPGVPENSDGPSFPHVFAVDGRRWHMLFCGWGPPPANGTIPNTTGLALSDDAGLTWRYHDSNPVIPMDRPYDQSGTGSCWVVKMGDEFRLYYTAIGEYFDKPPKVRTGHGDHIPRIGVAYAVSRDGVRWEKPLNHLVVSPRGLAADPYEYINSKPCVIRDGDGWRMFISTYGYAYRIRSLVSDDGLKWVRVPSGREGDLGVGAKGNFDDDKRCYASVIKAGETYHMWYSGNGAGAWGQPLYRPGGGIGYCVGRMI